MDCCESQIQPWSVLLSLNAIQTSNCRSSVRTPPVTSSVYYCLIIPDSSTIISCSVSNDSVEMHIISITIPDSTTILSCIVTGENCIYHSTTKWNGDLLSVILGPKKNGIYPRFPKENSIKKWWILEVVLRMKILKPVVILNQKILNRYSRMFETLENEKKTINEQLDGYDQV